ncbi:MAG: hypothetical protein KJ047_09135 [Anaerolineae bacterium]|nr:hypothetical protein [Anaerolineae bacterium]
MLPENQDELTDRRAAPPEIEPISIAEAQAILADALAPYLADGWHVLDRSPAWARLTRDKRNLDVRVDLLGEVEAHESGLTPLQDSGRLIAWVLLLAALLLMLAAAAALGIW